MTRKYEGLPSYLLMAISPVLVAAFFLVMLVVDNDAARWVGGKVKGVFR